MITVQTKQLWGKLTSWHTQHSVLYYTILNYKKRKLSGTKNVVEKGLHIRLDFYSLCKNIIQCTQE